MQDPCFAKRHPITHKMQVNLDMLGALMLNRVCREVDGGDVVTVDHRGARWRLMELAEKLAEPN